ncbi:MAG: hypothetical protein EZS28_039981 [Streblomastix strix]|uniref:Uncharacterized protein n=1 Tax=Streblomastix strix TaxID=222440 RepID=A0A5J4U3H7_9EUKA|nr:MAG: hypothetical protein EZS28_039981 [Streblomastix strix]
MGGLVQIQLSDLSAIKAEFEETRAKLERMTEQSSELQNGLSDKQVENMKLREEISRLDSLVMRMKGQSVGVRLKLEDNEDEELNNELNNELDQEQIKDEQLMIIKGEGFGFLSEEERERKRMKEEIQQKQIWNKLTEEEDKQEEEKEQSHVKHKKIMKYHQ